MKFRLSQIIPMPFTAVYGVEIGGTEQTELAQWWQWRDYVFFHRTSRYQTICR